MNSTLVSMLLKNFAYSFISWPKASFEPRSVLF